MLNQTENNCQLFSLGEVYNSFPHQTVLGPVEFLTSLFSNCQPESGYVNIRCFPSKNNLFVSQTDIQDLLPYFLEANQDKTIFFGVALREWNNGTKNGVVEIPAIWCEIDFKNVPENEVREGIKNFPLQPTFVVNSGGGFHLYFKLKEPVSRDDIPRVENLLKRLTLYFKGDRSATDASRVMRLPGSRNFKYEPARDVTIETFYPEREYDLDDFDILPPIEEDIPLEPIFSEPWGDYSNAEELIQKVTDIAQPGRRNLIGFILGCKLRDMGLTFTKAIPLILKYVQEVKERGDHPYTPREALRSLAQAFKQSPSSSLSANISRMIDFLLKEKEVGIDSQEKVYQIPKSQQKCGRGGLNAIPKPGRKLTRGLRVPYYCGLRTCPVCGPRKAEEHKMELKAFIPNPYFKFIPDESRLAEYQHSYRKGARCRWVFDPETGLTLFLTDIQVRDSLPIPSGEEYDRLLNLFVKVPSKYVRAKDLIGGTYMHDKQKSTGKDVIKVMKGEKESATSSPKEQATSEYCESDYYFFKDTGKLDEVKESYERLGCKVTVINGVLDIECSEKAIKLFDAKARGKLIPSSGEWDPLWAATFLDRSSRRGG